MVDGLSSHRFAFDFQSRCCTAADHDDLSPSLKNTTNTTLLVIIVVKHIGSFIIRVVLIRCYVNDVSKPILQQPAAADNAYINGEGIPKGDYCIIGISLSSQVFGYD